MTPLDGDARSHVRSTSRTRSCRRPKPLTESRSMRLMAESSQPTGGVVKTVDNVPGGYVIGPDGKPTNELKKGLPDSGSPNHPVGQPVVGHVPSAAVQVRMPPPALQDQGQPAGAPLANPALAPANQPQVQRGPVPPTPPPMGPVKTQAPPAPLAPKK